MFLNGVSDATAGDDEDDDDDDDGTMNGLRVRRGLVWRPSCLVHMKMNVRAGDGVW